MKLIKKIYAIYDEKAEAYLQPFFLDTQGQAIRAIVDCLSDPDHNFSRHPADYTLFQVGEFNNELGLIVEDKKTIGNLVEFIPKLDSVLGDTTKLTVIGGTE